MPHSGDEPMTVDEESGWISSDKSVSKVVLSNGTWDGAPQEGGLCFVNFEEVNCDVGNSEYLRENRTEIVIGEADTDFDRLIDRALRQMWTGEKSRLTLYDRFTLIVTLRYFKNPEIPFYCLEPEGKIKLAESHKAKGNELFAQGRFRDAFLRFQKAVRFVIFACVEENQEIYCKLCNNLALCKLRMNQPDEAVNLCNKVLSRCENNVKGLVHRAEALLLTHEPDSARDDLMKALEIDPANAAARKLLGSANKDIAQQKIESTTMAKKMLCL